MSECLNGLVSGVEFVASSVSLFFQSLVHLQAVKELGNFVNNV